MVSRNIKESKFSNGVGLNAPVITNLDDIDAQVNGGNDDGFAVIDIYTGGAAFAVTNTDWILQSAIDPLTGKAKTTAIFRLAEGTFFDFENSSIMLGDGTPDEVCVDTNDPVGCKTDGSQKVIDEIGAVFFTDVKYSTNAVIDLSNVILGGIGLWDFTDFNPSSTVRLSKNDNGTGNSVKVVRPGDLSLINMQNAQGCGQFISDQVLMSNNRWTGCTQLAEDVPEPSAWWLMGFGLLGVEVLRRFRPAKSAVL